MRSSLAGCIVAPVVCLAFFWHTSPAIAQTVQLPSFGFFSYSGAVSVPDGGAIQAGSIKRHAEGAVSNGLPGLSGIQGFNRGFRNNAIGRETGSSSLTIKPTILIMSELEEDHLAAAGYGPDAGQAGFADSVVAKAAFLTRNMGRNKVPPGQSADSYNSGKR